jgi:hypothetical protein
VTEQPLTMQQALSNAARILHNAETETNLPLMERLEHLAGAWIDIATLLHEHENA